MSAISLLDALRTATEFEGAAMACLSEVLRIADAAALASGLPGAVILRVMLHLRPGSGYRGLYMLEPGSDAVASPREGLDLLPSLAAWRQVEAERQAVAVDVALRQIAPGRGGEARALAWRGRGSLSNESQTRLLDRDATHLYVVPILAGPEVAGMVTVEAACMAAAGRPFIWSACGGAIEVAVALATPFLLALPRRTTVLVEADPLLPVVGATMAPLVRLAGAFAREDETLLIYGETGTGKSRLARWCHARSPRRNGPFEVLDLLTVPADTQMGELFGWKRGAFTGAVSDHDGFVTRAEGGTLFIDEVDKLSLPAQAGLLTLLEERRFRVLGDRGTVKTADVRFIVGTNVDLRAAVAEGRFREDLFYRLDVLSLSLPPLRERLDELAGWARFMLARRQQGRSRVVELSADALAMLQRRRWAGNLRELDNVLRRAATLAGLEVEGDRVVIELTHLGTEPRPVSPDGGAMRVLAEGAAELVDRLRVNPVDLADLDLPGALYGLVLAEGVARTDSREVVFQLLGREELLKNRNHHKVLRRDAGRAADLARRLEEPVPPAVTRLLDD